jgi:hypothetical protein
MAEHKVSKVHATVSGAGSGTEVNVSQAHVTALLAGNAIRVSQAHVTVLWTTFAPPVPPPGEEEEESGEDLPLPGPSICDAFKEAGFMTEIGLNIVNCALTAAGANPIASFEENSTEAKFARECYVDEVCAMMGNYRWRFAAKEVVLNKLANVPLAQYEEAYQLPVDLLIINGLFMQDGRSPVSEFDRYRDQIYLNFTTEQNVVLEYTYCAPEQYWPAYFAKAMELQLASMYASQLTRNGEIIALFMEQKERQWRIAKNLDSSSQTTRRIVNSRLTAIRN